MKLEAPRGARQDEFSQVMELVNQVFKPKNGVSLEYQFLTLLCPENSENMQIISADGQPVACFNLYKGSLEIYGTSIEIAFVGAVATHKDFRGKGLGGSLVEYSEEKMRGEGADVILISGNKSIYTKRSYTEEFTYAAGEIKPGTPHSDVEIISLTEDMIHLARKIYLTEPVRFIRSYGDYKKLFHGTQLCEDFKGNFIFMIKKQGVYSAYILLRYEPENRGLFVCEYAGNRSSIIDALVMICDSPVKYGLTSCKNITCVYPGWDLVMHAEMLGKDIKPVYKSVNHTIKVINLGGLINKLMPYFSQIVDAELLKTLYAGFDGMTYTIELSGECFKTDDVKAVNRLLFGNGVEGILPNDKYPVLNQFFNDVFPLPMPYVFNMNYI